MSIKRDPPKSAPGEDYDNARHQDLPRVGAGLAQPSDLRPCGITSTGRAFPVNLAPNIPTSGLRVIRMNAEGAHLRDGDKLGISGDGYLWAFLGNLTPNSVRTTVAAVLSDTSGRMRPLVLRPSGSL